MHIRGTLSLARIGLFSHLIISFGSTCILAGRYQGIDIDIEGRICMPFVIDVVQELDVAGTVTNDERLAVLSRSLATLTKPLCQ